jgi:hypothetical protein
MRSLQIWLPTINPSLSTPEESQDMHRAFETWHGERTVWLLPEIQAPCRWQEGPSPWDWVLAIPAEHTERIDIYHVNTHGSVWGIGAMQRFPHGCGEGLLNAWLNVFRGEGCRLYACPETFSLPIPCLIEGAVEYKDEIFHIEPTNLFPMVATPDAERWNAVAVWPPKGCPAPISPEAESNVRYGPFVRHKADKGPLITSTQDPALRGIHVAVRWPDPLQNLLGILAGPDVLFHQAQMVNIARRSVDDHQEALHKARNIAGSYVMPGWTTTEHIELWPLLSAKQAAEGLRSGHLDQAVREVASKLRLGEASWETAQHSPVWRKRMEARHTITRAWGPIGLFWALLLEHLDQGRRFPECEDCHRLNPGKKGKQFCGPDDDPLCYARRLARNRRNERESSPRTAQTQRKVKNHANDIHSAHSRRLPRRRVD